MTRSAPASCRSSPTMRHSSAAPGVMSAPHAAAKPYPAPPAAPAPGASGSPPRTCARRARPASRTATCAGPAPFCGPNTAAAPRRPSSRARTSVRQTTPRGGGRRRPVRSAEARPPSAPPPARSSCPAASRKRAPRAARAPVPPSVDADPPRAMTIRRAPASSALAISSPVPMVCAPSGSGAAISGSPLARASSMHAVALSSSSQQLATVPPPGPVTWTGCQRGAGPAVASSAAASTSSVPSPPSASGTHASSSPGRSTRQPAASAAAASAAPMLPLKESGATTIRTRSARHLPRGAIRRQSQAGADGLLDLLGIGLGVDGDHVLLAAEDVEHRVGLIVVLAEPDREGLLGVVLPPLELAAADVAFPGHLGTAGQQVVVHAAARAEPSGHDPAPDLAVGEVEVDHAVDVVALQEELRLPLVAGEAVDDEPVVPVVLGQPIPHDALDQVVVDQLALGHGAPDLGAGLGVVLHVPAEDVADADVHQIQVSGEHRALCALAAALHAHDDVLAHAASLAHRPGPWLSERAWLSQRLADISRAQQREPALAPAAQLGVERCPDDRPVFAQQPRVEESGHVVAPALAQHDAVHAAAGAVVGHVELSHARPRQVPGQHDHSLGRPAQVLQSLRKPPCVPATPGEKFRKRHGSDYRRPAGSAW